MNEKDKFAFIDRFLSDFEAQWKQGNCPSAIEHIQKISPLEQSYVVSLVALVDLEYRRAARKLPTNLPAYLQKLGLPTNEIAELAASYNNNKAPQHKVTMMSIGSVSVHNPLIPNFELLEVIGRGAMGVVYRARQLEPERVVALKLMTTGVIPSDEELQRFRREADILAKLQHTNIVRLLESGHSQTTPWYAMEIVEGSPLDQHLANNTLSNKPIARLLTQAAEALSYAHSLGVIHRDITPGNIMVDSAGVAKILDFGLARTIRPAETMTRAGVIVGTVGYMSPEQATSGVVDHRTDVYGLGAVLYRCLTQRPPFHISPNTEANITSDEAYIAYTNRLQRDIPVEPRLIDPQISAGLNTLCMKCIHTDPADRFQSVQELAEELKRFTRDEPLVTRPPSVLGRLFLWARRRPAAAMIGILTTVVVLMLSIGTPLYFRQRIHGLESAAKLASSRAKIELQERQAQQREFYIGVSKVRELSKIKASGFAWESMQLLEELAGSLHAKGDLVQLRSLVADTLTSQDWRPVKRFAGGFNSADIAVSEDGTMLAIAEIRSVSGCRIHVYRTVRDAENRPNVEFIREYRGSFFDGMIRNALQGIGALPKTRAEGFRSVCFSPDGRMLIAGSRHGDIWQWDLNSSSTTPAVHRSSLNSNGFEQIAALDDGTTFAIAATGKDVVEVYGPTEALPTWKSDLEAQVSSLSQISEEIYFMHNNVLMKGRDGELPYEFAELDSRFASGVVGMSGAMLAGQPSGKSRLRLHCYDTLSGESTGQYELTPHTRNMLACKPQLSPDSTMLLTTLDPNLVGLWDNLSGAMVSCVAILNTDNPMTAWLHDSQFATIGDADGVQLYETWNSSNGGGILRSIVTGASPALAFDISPDGLELAILDEGIGKRSYSRAQVFGLDDGKVRATWSSTVALECQPLPGRWPLVNRIQYSPDGELLAAMGSPGLWLRLTSDGFKTWISERATIYTEFDRDDDELSFSASATVNTPRSLIGLALDRSKLPLDPQDVLRIDLTIGDTTQTVQLQGSVIGRLGRWQQHALATVERTGTDALMVIASIRSRKHGNFSPDLALRLTSTPWFSGRPQTLETFAFQKDGALLTVGENNLLRIQSGFDHESSLSWADAINQNAVIRDIATGAVDSILSTRRGQLFRVAGSKRIEFLGKGIRIAADRENENEIGCVAADDAQITIIAGRRDGKVSCLRRKDKSEFGEEILQHHRLSVSAVAISKNGRIGATGDTSGRLVFWDFTASPPEKLFEINTMTGGIRDMQFTPNASRLVILCRDERGIRILELDQLFRRMKSLHLLNNEFTK